MASFVWLVWFLSRPGCRILDLQYTIIEARIMLKSIGACAWMSRAYVKPHLHGNRRSYHKITCTGTLGPIPKKFS